MLGIIPAAGVGSRIQPLAFSKEVLPVGGQRGDDGVERPKAVSEFLVERMLRAGTDRICVVIAPEKTDIVQFYARHPEAGRFFYVVQDRPVGLCDALFRAAPHVRPDEEVLIGLPDTIWYPVDGFARLPAGDLAFLLFPVEQPQHFDAVVTEGEAVVEIEVKVAQPRSRWVWGAFRMPAATFLELHRLWSESGRRDEYVGTLVNAYLARGGSARGIKAGERYYDVGTLDGYRAAVSMLAAAAAV